MMQRYGSIRAQLSDDGMYVYDIPADGNCFFRSIVDQLDGTRADVTNHTELRALVVETIRENKDFFSAFVMHDDDGGGGGDDSDNDDDHGNDKTNTSFESYVESMAQPDTWAGNIEIQAASLALKANVVIYQDGEPPWLVKNFDSPTSMLMHISYHDGNHYNSVRDVSTRRPASRSRGHELGGGEDGRDGESPSTPSRDRAPPSSPRVIDGNASSRLTDNGDTCRVRVRLRVVFSTKGEEERGQEEEGYRISVSIRPRVKIPKRRNKKVQRSNIESNGQIRPSSKCSCGSKKKNKNCCRIGMGKPSPLGGNHDMALSRQL